MPSVKRLLAGVIGGTLFFGAVPALAVPATSGAPTTDQLKDPNRIICEKVQETGSRLNARKTCMTAQQWQEQHRRDREAVEEAQRQKGEPSGR